MSLVSLGCRVALVGGSGRLASGALPVEQPAWLFSPPSDPDLQIQRGQPPSPCVAPAVSQSSAFWGDALGHLPTSGAISVHAL